PRSSSTRAEDADVPADRAAAEDDRRCRRLLARRRLGREWDLGRKVARGRAGVDVEKRSRGDPDLDVSRDAREASVPGGQRLEADVARHGVRVDGARDCPDVQVAGDGLDGDIAIHALEVDVAADRPHGRVLVDLAPHTDVAGHAVHVEHAQVSGDIRIRRRGLDPHAGAVRYPRLDAEPAVAEDDRAEREREPELALVAQGHGYAVAVVPDLDVLEHPLVAVDRKAGLFAVGRLDVDVAARD